jgi:hypothetical protein
LLVGLLLTGSPCLLKFSGTAWLHGPAHAAGNTHLTNDILKCWPRNRLRAGAQAKGIGAMTCKLVWTDDSASAYMLLMWHTEPQHLSTYI